MASTSLILTPETYFDPIQSATNGKRMQKWFGGTFVLKR